MTNQVSQLVKILAENPAIFAQVLAAMQGTQSKPKASKAKAPKGRKARKAKVSTTLVDRLASKDQSILRGFAQKGIKGVVLMDRSDRSKSFNVRPFGRVNPDGSKSGWLAEGRVVKKGQRSVRGLFHVSQTEELAPKSAPAAA